MGFGLFARFLLTRSDSPAVPQTKRSQEKRAEVLLCPLRCQCFAEGKTKASYLINSRERLRITSTMSTDFPFYMLQPLINASFLESVDKRRHIAWLKHIFAPLALHVVR